MRAKELAAALAGGALSLAVAGGAGAQSLVNGSFEKGDFYDNEGGQDVDLLSVGSIAMTGWTTLGPTQVAWIGAGNPFGLAPYSGGFFLDLTGYHSGPPFGGVSQTLATEKNDLYQLTYELGSDSDGSTAGITASADGQSASATYRNFPPTAEWQMETFDFTANAWSTTITLIGSDGANFIGLDDVILTRLSGPAPEPAAWSLMILGLAAIGCALRNSRAAPAVRPRAD
jgi:hypothetical protein